MRRNKIILIVLILSMIALIFSGCGGISTAPSISPEPENSFSEEFVLVQVTNLESNLIFVIGKEDEDTMAILGDKDTEGNPTDITGAVYISEQGDSFAIEAGIDGLPTYLIDSEGNKVIFENYTNSTVDISIYDSSGSLIQDTTTINLDPADLLEIKQLYNSFYSRQRWSNENTEFALKWGAVGLGWVGCIGSGGLAVLSGGALTPIAAWACGGAIFSTIATVTPTDIDNNISTTISSTTCILSGGYAVYACGSSIANLLNLAIEGQDVDTNHPPTISSLTANPSSVDISQTATITCIASDPDGDTLNYTWIKTGGTFVGSTSGSSVTWTASSTTGTYTILCAVSDGEGGEDNESVNIVVTESDEDKIRSVCSKLISALNSKNWNEARSYCIYGSEAYNEIGDLEDLINNWEFWYGTTTLNINENINNVVINGNYATAYGYFSYIFTAGSYVEENSGSVTGYLEKIGSNWKIYKGVIPNL